MRLIIAYICLFIALSGRLAYSIITPTKTKTAVGFSIKGKKHAVMTHGGLANVESMFAWAYALSDQGYAVELINLPNHGSWHSYGTTSGVQKWIENSQPYKPTLGVGHSLGAYVIQKSDIPIQILIGRKAKKSSNQYILIGHLFPSSLSLLDHVLEPWNPLLIERGLKNLGYTISHQEKVYIWAYCILPWVVFFCGILGTILIVPTIIQRIFPKNTDNFVKNRVVFSSAFILILSFVFATSGSLWKTTLTSIFEWFLFLGGATVAWLIQVMCCKYLPKDISDYVSNISVWSWCLLSGFLVSEIWSLWPGEGIMHLVWKLMFVVSVPVFFTSRSLHLSTNYERNMCGVLLYFYALAVLTPKILIF